jgi:hypothetical protein
MDGIFSWLLRGTGGGDFFYVNKEWEIEDKSAASVMMACGFGDIDGDGDLDVIGYTGTLDGQRMLNVYRNDSAGKTGCASGPLAHPAIAGRPVQRFALLVRTNRLCCCGSSKSKSWIVKARTAITPWRKRSDISALQAVRDRCERRVLSVRKRVEKKAVAAQCDHHNYRRFPMKPPLELTPLA